MRNIRSSTRRNQYLRFHFLVAGGIAILGTIGIWWLLSRQVEWWHWVLCWLAITNVLAFGYYGFDKARARAGRSRVPELVLHAIAIAGGSIGAYLGMKLFRHKTIKGQFQILFWCIATLQVLLLALVLKFIVWG